MPRDQEGTLTKRWIQRNVRFGLVSYIRVCSRNGRYSFEVQVQSLFQDQIVSWIRNVNGVDKFVREAMLIQEEEKASVKPTAKARPRLNPSSISDVNFIPTGQRKWMDIETQEPMILIVLKFRNSSLDYYDTVKKFIEKMMEQSIMTQLLVNARKSNSTTVNIGQLRGRRNSSMLRVGRLKVDISSGKRWRTKEKASMDQLYRRESVILRPRDVLKANSQCVSQDQPAQEARSSWESQRDAESYGETRSHTAPGISISRVKLQDARRQNKVTKLVRKTSA